MKAKISTTNRITKLYRIKCHILFDKFWSSKDERTMAYRRLANKLNIPLHECHFALMDLKRLKKSYCILVRWNAVKKVK